LLDLRTRKKRQNTKTANSLAPLTVNEVLSAMLKTPPPKGDKEGRKSLAKKSG
jgi:hypothetical protein